MTDEKLRALEARMEAESDPVVRRMFELAAATLRADLGARGRLPAAVAAALAAHPAEARRLAAHGEKKLWGFFIGQIRSELPGVDPWAVRAELEVQAERDWA